MSDGTMQVYKENQIEKVLKELGLSLRFQFVPFSLSRSKENKEHSLNWTVCVLKNELEFHDDKLVLTTDYSAGIAHCPSYEQGWTMTVDVLNAVKLECETGKSQKSKYNQPPILPKVSDVFYCIISDCDVLNYNSFEDWASNFGYDSDSRKAEKTYQDCLRIALTFRNYIGDDGIKKLQEVFQDY